MRAVSRDEARLYALKRFFTGEPCSRGHVDERLTSNGCCVVCHRERSLGHYHANADKCIARIIAHRNAHRDTHNETRREHYQKNRDAIKKQNADYKARNIEKIRAHDRSRPWHRGNPERANALYALRARRKRQAMPCWANREKILAIYREARSKGLTVDHIIPLNGEFVCGLHVHTNLRVLSREDNIRKSNKFDPMTFECECLNDELRKAA